MKYSYLNILVKLGNPTRYLLSLRQSNYHPGKVINYRQKVNYRLAKCDYRPQKVTNSLGKSNYLPKKVTNRKNRLLLSFV